MRLAVLLVLLPLAAPAQDAPLTGPGSLSPVTGEPRPAFDPISADETALAINACLDRSLLDLGPEAAVGACHGETLAFCEAVVAAFPLARNECLLEQGLAWGDVRHEAGMAFLDILYASDDPGALPEVDAFVEADGAWREENGNACLGLDEAGRRACRLAREMERAALYLGRAKALLDPS